MTATQMVNGVVVVTTVVFTVASLFKRGFKNENIADAVQDGFGVAQLPTGIGLLLGLMGLLDDATLAKLMADSAAGLWAAAVLISLGCVGLGQIFKR